MKTPFSRAHEPDMDSLPEDSPPEDSPADEDDEESPSSAWREAKRRSMSPAVPSIYWSCCVFTHTQHRERCEPCESMSDPFVYASPRHKTAEACQKSGCTLRHWNLEELGATVGRGWLTERPGQPLRQVLRKAVRRNEIQGTCKVPDPKNKADAGCMRQATERVRWWWHDGDPDIQRVRRLLIQLAPPDPSKSQDCAICLDAWSATNDPDSIYSKPACCGHTFHRACMMQWLQDDQGTCPVCRAVHEELECAACEEPGEMIICERCPKAYHIDEECLPAPALGRAQASLDDSTWLCPECAGEVGGPPAKKQRLADAAASSVGEAAPGPDGSSCSSTIDGAVRCSSDGGSGCGDSSGLHSNSGAGSSSGSCWPLPPATSACASACASDTAIATGHGLVGRRVRVWFDGPEAWYAGRVKSFSKSRKYCIAYDSVPGEDDLTENCDLESERWELM